MKKLLFTILFLLIATPISAKMLWEYGSFSERAEMAIDNGIVANINEYKGTYEQNIHLLDAIKSPYVESFGASTQPAALATYNLAGSGVSSSATSLTLQSLTITQNSYKIQDSDLSDIFYVTLEPGSKTRQEIASCTTVTQNSGGTATLSGCTRGLSPITPYTASSSLQFSHAGGSQIIFSDAPQLFNQYPAKSNSEDITGYWTFNSVLPSSTLTATTTNQFTTKEYVDNTTNQGAATSTETTAGISELATPIEVASSTQFDANNPHVINSEQATSTPTYSCDTSGTTGALCIPVAKNNGKLHQDWIDYSEAITFSGDNTLSGENTFSATTTMATTTIANGTITSSEIASTTIANGTITGTPTIGNDIINKTYFDTYTNIDFGTYSTSTISNGTVQTISHTLGRTPKILRIKAIINGSGAPGVFSDGVYDGTAQSVVFYGITGAGTVTGTTNDTIILNVDTQQGGGGVYATASALNSSSFTLTWTVAANEPTILLWEVE